MGVNIPLKNPQISPPTHIFSGLTPPNFFVWKIVKMNQLFHRNYLIFEPILDRFNGFRGAVQLVDFISRLSGDHEFWFGEIFNSDSKIVKISVFRLEKSLHWVKKSWEQKTLLNFQSQIFVERSKTFRKITRNSRLFPSRNRNFKITIFA